MFNRNYFGFYKKKDAEIASLKTDLEICENRIEELEKVNKELQEINIKYSKQLLVMRQRRIG